MVGTLFVMLFANNGDNYIIIIVVIIYIDMYCYFIWKSILIQFKNLDEVVTYNHIALISLRINSHAKSSAFMIALILLYTIT